MSLKEKLFAYLEELKDMEFSDMDIPYEVCNDKASVVLQFIFYVRRSRINFTRKERRRLGNLVIDTIGSIKFSLACTLTSSIRFSSLLLMKRSALQFLLDDFGRFPARNSTLKKELEKADIGQTIKKFDQIINRLYNYLDSSDDSDLESAGASDVPDTHTWWFP